MATSPIDESSTPSQITANPDSVEILDLGGGTVALLGASPPEPSPSVDSAYQGAKLGAEINGQLALLNGTCLGISMGDDVLPILFPANVTTSNGAGGITVKGVSLSVGDTVGGSGGFFDRTTPVAEAALGEVRAQGPCSDASGVWSFNATSLHKVHP